jgi:hypothetical protein
MSGNMAAGAAEAAQPTTLMSSFFPSPPSHFANFTQTNLALARKLVEHPSYSSEDVKTNTDDPKAWLTMQAKVLKELDVSDEEIDRVKEVDLASLLNPPDVDLVESDGHWMAFGQAWPVNATPRELYYLSTDFIAHSDSREIANVGRDGRQAALPDPYDLGRYVVPFSSL